MRSLLGKTVKDRVTGVVGVVTGVADWIDGTTSVCIQPAVLADGKLPDRQWADVRAVLEQGGDAIVLESPR